MKNNNDKNQKKGKTWGNVTPGPLSEGEEKALRPAMDKAAKEGKQVSSPKMDPEHNSGEKKTQAKDKNQEWQKLSKEEQKKTDERKGGYPKNLGRK